MLELARLLIFLTLASLLAATSAGADSAEAVDRVPTGIVKVTSIHNHPDFISPWQRKGPHSVTGSGVIISGNRILTNAHIVEDETIIEVQRGGESRRYTAELVNVCHPCDLAVLTVKDEEFFEGAEPLPVGGLPALQSRVSVYGFPEGGESVSVTAGVVSRIELSYYVHSSKTLLRGQIDAAINPGNSGGPVVSGGEIVGIAMQMLQASENIGYMVPTPVVLHFLEDVEDGRFDGFPELGIMYQRLENGALRRHLGLPEDGGGVLVVGVARGSAAEGTIEPGDILLAYDGQPIDREGNVQLADGLRVDCTHLELSKQVGESLRIRLRREGKDLEESIALRDFQKLVPQRSYLEPPRYFVFAGLVFQPLTTKYLWEFRRPPARLMRYHTQFTAGTYRSLGPNGEGDPREEIIVISSILADEINRGYAAFEDHVIKSVNGERVRSLGHLISLVEGADSEFLELITENGAVLAIDLEEARSRSAAILERYSVPSDRSRAPLASPASER